MSYQYLPLETVEEFLPYMDAELGPAGAFLGAYRQARGNPDLLSDQWDQKRDAFIKRHMAQAKARREPLWQGGEPTRRHLALIAWAYSPHAKRVIG
jgi:hypothetical protein